MCSTCIPNGHGLDFEASPGGPAGNASARTSTSFHHLKIRVFSFSVSRTLLHIQSHVESIIVTIMPADLAKYAVRPLRKSRSNCSALIFRASAMIVEVARSVRSCSLEEHSLTSI